MLKFITAPVSAALDRFHQRRADQVRERLASADPPVALANEPAEVPLAVRRRALAAAPGLEDRPGEPEWITVPVRVRPLEWLLLLDRGERAVLRPPDLTALSATETFLVYFKVSLYCGVVLASPWIFYQLWAFVAVGLYPHERRRVYVYLPLSVVLFLGGLALWQFVVIPLGVEYLLGFNGERIRRLRRRWSSLPVPCRLCQRLGRRSGPPRPRTRDWSVPHWPGGFRCPCWSCRSTTSTCSTAPGR